MTRSDQNYGPDLAIRLYWYYWGGLGETMRGWRWEITCVMPDQQMSRENTSYFVPGINTSSLHNDIWQTDNNPRLDDHHTFLSLRNAEEVRGRIISQWRNLVSCVLFHHLPSGHRRGVKGPSLAWLLIEGSGSELNDIAVKRNLFYQSPGDTWMILINFFVLSCSFQIEPW